MHIGLGQLRRVVNRLIEVYGKPEDIVVEIGALPEDEQGAEALKYQRRQKRGQESATTDLSEMLKGAEVVCQRRNTQEAADYGRNKDSVRIVICPYTGRQTLFRDGRYRRRPRLTTYCRSPARWTTR